MEDLTEAYLSIYDNINEVKGFGGRVDPNTGKFTGEVSTPGQKVFQQYTKDVQHLGRQAGSSARSRSITHGEPSESGVVRSQARGVDVTKQDPGLAMTPAKTVNDMVDVATKLMDAGVDLIVVDSISALLPAIYFEKDGNEMKDLQDTKQIGAEAKDMTHAVKMLNYANKDTLLVLISQQRNQFGSMHASHIPTGGMAVKFFSSTVIKLWSSEAEANAIKAGVKVGEKL